MPLGSGRASAQNRLETPDPEPLREQARVHYTKVLDLMLMPFLSLGRQRRVGRMIFASDLTLESGWSYILAESEKSSDASSKDHNIKTWRSLAN